MTNKIKFTYIGKYPYKVHDHPKPSAQQLPDWFSDMQSYHSTETNPDGKKFEIRNGASTATAKKCTPMLDAITGGYTVSLWTDVWIEKNETGEQQVSWRTKDAVFAEHGPSASLITGPPGYNTAVLKYLTNFRVSTPLGYSILVKPPGGYYDLPFMPLTAIIDTDSSVIDTNIPVWLKKDVSGVIEKGTPIAQIFPFKRESWEMQVDMMESDDFDIDVDRGFSRTLINNYVKNHRYKKSFK
jgi:hypothetical protein